MREYYSWYRERHKTSRTAHLFPRRAQARCNIDFFMLNQTTDGQKCGTWGKPVLLVVVKSYNIGNATEKPLKIVDSKETSMPTEFFTISKSIFVRESLVGLNDSLSFFMHVRDQL